MCDFLGVVIVTGSEEAAEGMTSFFSGGRRLGRAWLGFADTELSVQLPRRRSCSLLGVLVYEAGANRIGPSAWHSHDSPATTRLR